MFSIKSLVLVKTEKYFEQLFQLLLKKKCKNAKSLVNKHEADDLMLKKISQIQ